MKNNVVIGFVVGYVYIFRISSQLSFFVFEERASARVQSVMRDWDCTCEQQKISVDRDESKQENTTKLPDEKHIFTLLIFVGVSEGASRLEARLVLRFKIIKKDMSHKEISIREVNKPAPLKPSFLLYVRGSREAAVYRCLLVCLATLLVVHGVYSTIDVILANYDNVELSSQ